MKNTWWLLAIGLLGMCGSREMVWAQSTEVSEAKAGLLGERLATSQTAPITEYDVGDLSSMTLTSKAWNALANGDHATVEVYAKKCIALYEAKALQMQASLTNFVPTNEPQTVQNYWALNDVATCYFIWGESLMNQRRDQEAKVAFERIVNDFSFAQCWDPPPHGWFWKVAVAARGQLNKIRVESSEKGG